MSLRTNVIANYVGQGWTAFMGIAFLPLYARLLGMEAYGLIGVFAVMLAWMTLMDMGLTPTVSREMAMLRAGVRSPEVTRDLLRSVEVLWGGLACAIVAAIWLGAPWLAHAWLKPQDLPQSLIVRSLHVIAFVLATRWLEQIYRGCLLGLQDMVWLNTAQVLLATLRWAGAYFILLRVPSVMTFFAWQGGVSVVTAGALMWRTYQVLPGSRRPGAFSLGALREVRTFAGGMFISAALSFLLMQSDKIIVSSLLPLDALGAYTLAANAVTGLLQIMMPMNAAIYPRLTELATRNEGTVLASTYQRACQWMAAVIVPPAFVMTFFPQLTLMAWTGNLQLVSTVAPLLSVLALGTLCNGLMNLPYYLQLAYGWTGLAVRTNIVAVSIIIPVTFWAVPRFGAVGAAYAWLLLNVGYLFVTSYFMHLRLLPDSKRQWYRDAVALPLTIGAIVALSMRWFVPQFTGRLSAAAILVAVAATLAVSISCSLPLVRRDIVEHIQRMSSTRRVRGK